MNTLRFFTLLLLISSVGCSRSPSNIDWTNSPTMEPADTTIKGALLSTRFKSLEELNEAIQIEYAQVSGGILGKKSLVRLRHFSNGRAITSELKSGISDLDIMDAWTGGFWKRAWLGLNHPYLVLHGKDFLRIFNLARRRGTLYGEGDVAFYDFAESMLYNINDDDLALMNPEDLSEKGYINTFNHINAQAIMTSLFSEKFADFIADVHERGNMPELITGEFTEEHLIDLEKGPTDNYVDIINNEWGQELGKILQKKYRISRETHWTPELLADYLNDLQAYYSWAFQFGFKPFKAADQLVITYSNKLNKVMTHNARLN